MVSVLFALIAQPVTLPFPKVEKVLGESVARNGSNYHALYGKDWQSLGSWWDGRQRCTTEWVLRLSPSLCARWLGYWSEREGWSPGEAQNRWEQIFRANPSRIIYVVQVSAYPKVSTLEITEAAAADTSTLKIEKARIDKDENAIPITINRLNQLQVRNRDFIESYAWWSSVPGIAPLTPNYFAPPQPPAYPLGDYFGQWFWFEAPTKLEPPYEVVLVSRGKVRRATFR